MLFLLKLSLNCEINICSFHLLTRDTAEQERFRSFIPSYICGSSVAVIVYDVASTYLKRYYALLSDSLNSANFCALLSLYLLVFILLYLNMMKN